MLITVPDKTLESNSDVTFDSSSQSTSCFSVAVALTLAMVAGAGNGGSVGKRVFGFAASCRDKE